DRLRLQAPLRRRVPPAPADRPAQRDPRLAAGPPGAADRDQKPLLAEGARTGEGLGLRRQGAGRAGAAVPPGDSDGRALQLRAEGAVLVGRPARQPDVRGRLLRGTLPDVRRLLPQPVALPRRTLSPRLRDGRSAGRPAAVPRRAYPHRGTEQVPRPGRTGADRAGALVLLSPVRRLARPERLPATLDTPLIRQAVEVLMAVSRDEAER